jgi:small subunit ribosomal protein S3
VGFRLGIIRDWQGKWYAKGSFAEALHEDIKVRQAIQSKYREAAISQMEINRQAKDVTITIHTARPGIVIGRGGQRVDEMRAYLEKLIGRRVRLNIQEMRQPELDAFLVARTIADQIEHRVAYRRAMKQAMFRTMQAGAKGTKISCAGRLGNAEIARRQTMHQGQVPLHTLVADLDYGFTEAHTQLGRIGVKVWIYKGQVVLEKGRGAEETAGAPSAKAETEEAPATEEVEVKEALAVEAAEPAAEPVAETAPEPAAKAKTGTEEEKPKPRARRKKAEAPAAGEEAGTEKAVTEPATAEVTEAEAKPKARTRRKKAEGTEETAASTAAEPENKSTGEGEDAAT